MAGEFKSLGSTGERCFDASHRSYSGDRLWDECQYKWDWMQRNGAGLKLNEAMAVGKIVDGLATRIVEGATLSDDDIRAAARAEFSHADLSDVPGDRYLESVDKSIAMTRLFEREVLPQLGKVTGTQMMLHWDYEGVTYHAHLDLVCEDGTISDLKTTSRRLEERRADRDFQLSYYAWGIQQVFGFIPTVRLDALVGANPPADVKRWKPDATNPWHDVQISHRSEQSIEQFAREVHKRERARRMATEFELFATNGFTSQFACNGCRAKSVCPAWAGIE